MRITEIPEALIMCFIHEAFGKQGVKSRLRQYYRSEKLKLKSDEYAASFHNHSCDGKVQEIKDIAYEAAMQGCTFLVISDHNMDKPFKTQVGDKIAGHYNFGGKIVYVIKGMECKCRTRPKNKLADLVFIGYSGEIKPDLLIDDAISAAKAGGALIGVTSPLNEAFFGAGRQEVERLLRERKVDYVETRNAGIGVPFFYNDALAEFMLSEYNRFRVDGEKIGGIYVSDSHVKKHVMAAYFGVKKSDFEFAQNPEYIESNPRMLIEAFGRAFRDNAVTNYGTHLALSEVLLDKEKLETIVKQWSETWRKDYLHGRFRKHRER